MIERDVTVSIVIPVKNDASKLERCLEALHEQTVAPAEILIVDNDSVDLTSLVSTWWGTGYAFEPRRGIAAAASAGYDLATGDIIARLDADSIPAADWVERIVAAFAAQPELDAVTGPGQFTSLPRPFRRVVDIVYMRAYFVAFGLLAGHPPVFGSNFAMRRPVWLAASPRVHRADSEVHDDLDLSFRMPRHAQVRIDQKLVVAVSGRPFTDPGAFLRRVRRGLHTVRVNSRFGVNPLLGMREVDLSSEIEVSKGS